MMTAALGLLTATHADSRMAGPVTVDYLTGVPTDRGSGSLLLFRMRFHMRFQQLGPSPGQFFVLIRAAGCSVFGQ